jgi:uncharacterized protein YjbI with pentapeptide repeats
VAPSGTRIAHRLSHEANTGSTLSRCQSGLWRLRRRLWPFEWRNFERWSLYRGNFERRNLDRWNLDRWNFERRNLDRWNLERGNLDRWSERRNVDRWKLDWRKLERILLE